MGILVLSDTMSLTVSQSQSYVHYQYIYNIYLMKVFSEISTLRLKHD